MNLYAYGANNPISLRDPFGLSSRRGNPFANPALWALMIGTEIAGGGPEDPLADAAVGEEIAAAEGEAGALPDINPLGGTQNCVNCAAQTDAMLRGQPYGPAALTGPQPISDLGTDWVPVSGPMQIGSILSESGPGSTGIVFGESPTGDIGHVWNAINNGEGGINFLDGQTGGDGLGNFDTFQNFQFLQTYP